MTPPGEPVKALETWNVLATAHDHEQRHLSALLRRFGHFWRTRFLGVFAGRVESPEALFAQLQEKEQERPGFLSPLSKLVPIETVFDFTPDTFEERLKQVVFSYVERIGNGSFYVRVERRGHVGEIHSQHAEQTLDKALKEHLAAVGRAATIDFKDPDVIIVAETIDDQCGVLTRAMRKRFQFVRVP